MDFLLKDQHRSQLAAEWKNLFDARQNNLFSGEIGLMILVFLKNMWKSAYKTDTTLKALMVFQDLREFILKSCT